MKTVGKLQIDTPSDREIRMTRVFDAPRQLVFDCWTRPELLKRWLTGPPGWSFLVCEVDLRVGGAYRFVWRNQSGTEMGMGGVYREVQPPDRIVNTELFDEDWTGGEAVSTLVLTGQGDRTTATNTMLYVSKAARDGVLGSGMESGMAHSYDNLAELLASALADRT